MEVKQSPREFLNEFIELYWSFPCLWHIKGKEYSDRNKKDLAYSELVKKYKEFDPSADRNTVVKKINALRTAYTPSLWYFGLLHFLDNQDTPSPTRSTMDGDEEIAQDEDSESTDLEQFHQREVTPSALPTPGLPGHDGSSTSRSETPSTSALRQKRKKNLNATEEVIQLA